VAIEPVTLGQHYRDALTGYAGVAIARCVYLHDAPDVKLQRLDTYGKPEEVWFDEARLVAEASAPATRAPGFGAT
jgi:hypothetical protein